MHIHRRPAHSRTVAHKRGDAYMRVRDCTLAILTAGASAPPGGLSLLPFAALTSAALGRGGEALRGGEVLRARPGVPAMESPSPCPPRRRHTADWQGRPATCTAAVTLALRLPSAGAGEGIVAADAIVTSGTAAPSSKSMRVHWRINAHERPGFIMVAARNADPSVRWRPSPRAMPSALPAQLSTQDKSHWPISASCTCPPGLQGPSGPSAKTSQPFHN